MRSRIVPVILAVLAVLVVGATPVLAFTEGATEEDGATEEEGATEEGTDITENESGVVPAEEAEAAEEETTEAPWTERFLAPTVLALGVLGVVGAVIYYFVRLRGRYQVVD